MYELCDLSYDEFVVMKYNVCYLFIVVDRLLLFLSNMLLKVKVEIYFNGYFKGFFVYYCFVLFYILYLC